MARRVGIFGGTFDPPHVGHLIMASEVGHLAGLDLVVLMVAHDPWQKSTGRRVSPAAVRLEMTTAAIGRSTRLVAGDLEIGRGGPTFTIDTVGEWRGRHPDDEVALVMGADAAVGLDSWHQADRLASEAEVVVVRRIGADGREPTLPGAPWRITPLDTPLVEVSSTDIRRRCREAIPVDYLVPEAVAAIIEARGLYRDEA